MPPVMFEHTQARLAPPGCRPTRFQPRPPGAACRHNLIYWRYQDYVGIGPGARPLRRRRRAAGEAGDAADERSGSLDRGCREHGPRHGGNFVDRRRDLVEEALMMDCGWPTESTARCSHLSLNWIRDRAGEDRLAPLTVGGLLEVDATHLRATLAGRQRLNAVLERLVA